RSPERQTGRRRWFWFRRRRPGCARRHHTWLEQAELAAGELRLAAEGKGAIAIAVTNGQARGPIDRCGVEPGAESAELLLLRVHRLVASCKVAEQYAGGALQTGIGRLQQELPEIAIDGVGPFANVLENADRVAIYGRPFRAAKVGQEAEIAANERRLDRPRALQAFGEKSTALAPLE